MLQPGLVEEVGDRGARVVVTRAAPDRVTGGPQQGGRGVVEVKDRASGEREDVALADVVGHVVDAVREPVGNPISEG